MGIIPVQRRLPIERVVARHSCNYVQKEMSYHQCSFVSLHDDDDIVSVDRQGVPWDDVAVFCARRLWHYVGRYHFQAVLAEVLAVPTYKSSYALVSVYSIERIDED